MIICPPSGLPPGGSDDSNTVTEKSRWGTYTRNKGTYHTTGLRKWSKPCSLLGGLSLYQWEKTYVAKQAALWKATPDTNTFKAAYIAHAATQPFTNLRGAYKTPTPFQLWMHLAKVHAYDYGGDLAGFRPRAGGYWGQILETTFQETDFPPARITAAEFHQNGNYQLTVTNWPPYVSNVQSVLVYVTLPHATSVKRWQVLCIDHTSPPDDSGIITNSPGNAPACLLKPYPIGSNILLAVRGVIAENGIMPSPLAGELVEVQP